MVPGIDSVVVRFDSLRHTAQAALNHIENVLASGIPPLKTDAELVEIPVVYGGAYGPDLDELCTATGLSRDGFIEIHTGSDYAVEMVGFTPGFAFIGGLDERLHIPRRAEPRARVEAGSVGIADGRTGLYPMASPGGWKIVGRTPRTMFDPSAAEPFVLRPGMRVRFKAIGAEAFEQ